MKYKTSELTGAMLDAAVAQAGGQLVAGYRIHDGALLVASNRDGDEAVMSGMELNAFSPSSDWSAGGPIIEREHIDLQGRCGAPHRDRIAPEWYARIVSGNFYGDTPLIAAMRAYVASKLGDEVELP